MKLSFLFFVNYLFLSSILYSSDKFVYGLEDIPLYKNTNNNEESLVLFDSINGRIVSTKINGSENLNEIKEFYRHILPNLGWNKTKENLFIRGEEVLEIKDTKYPCIVLERTTNNRKTLYYVAKTLDFILIKVEDDRKERTLSIEAEKILSFG